jgi:hypothetical protein
MIRHALMYAQRGWPVFPCKVRDKTPLTAHGVKDASTDPATIRQWWTRWPIANIGVDCGGAGLVVIDVDARNGGIQTWRTFYLAHRPGIPITVTSRTGGGGFHLFYQTPPGVDIRNTTSKLAQGVDVRAGGGYVILPPSLHTSGNRYLWDQRYGLDRITLAPLPPLLVNLLQAHPQHAQVMTSQASTVLTSPSSIDAITRTLARATEGERNSILLWCACRLFEHGMSVDQVEVALLPTALGIGLTGRESLATIRSAQSQQRRHLPALTPSTFMQRQVSHLRRLGVR